jgi:hypothetical protein
MTAIEVECLARACAMATWCLVAAYVWNVYQPWIARGR